MILSGHQPTFMPWGGYVAKYAACDAWVEMDAAQFERGSFQNRNYVRTRDGRAVLLTVPVEHNGKPVATRDLKIARGSRWKRKHIETLRQCYGKTPGWEQMGDTFEALYASERDWFCDFANLTADMLTEYLDVGPTVLHELLEPGLLDVCRDAGAEGFLFGSHGPDYVNVDEWKAAGVEPIFTTYQNPEWLTATTTEGKVVPVTVWDAVFRFGLERLPEILGGLRVRDEDQAGLIRLRTS